jgi:tetratricopeptide (TPR) repeat protein
MGFFNKMFGAKDAGNEPPVAPRSTDFITALTMHLRGEADPALNAYLQIIDAFPNDVLAPFFVAAISASKGNSVDAAERLRSLSHRIALGQETISLSITRELLDLVNSDPTLKMPAVAEVIVSFGDHLKAERLLQESAVCFEIAAALLPENAHVLHKFGDTLHDLRLYDYAESVLLKALQCAPNHWGALYTYAVLLQDLGRFPEAITYYEKAVKLNPEHVNCHNNYGSALMMTNRLEEALEQCTLAATIDPNSPLVKVNLGNIHLLMKEYEAARISFTEAISLEKNLAQAYFGLGSVEQLLGSDSRKIKELYLKAIELNPSIPDIHHALGNLLGNEGNPEALSYFSAAAQLNNYLRNLHRDFGRVCLQLGRRDEALEHLKTALQQNPDDGLARDMLTKAEAENLT